MSSKILSIVPTTGVAIPTLTAFAKALISKVTKNTITINTTTTAAAFTAANNNINNNNINNINNNNAISIGIEAPTGVHTALVKAPGTISPYIGVHTTLIRAILPKYNSSEFNSSENDYDYDLPLRDAVDTLLLSPSINIEREMEIVSKSFEKSAKEVVSAAKESKATKVLLVIKPQTAHTNINNIFTKVATTILNDAGLTIETTTTSLATNQLIMFPEDYNNNIIFTNDYIATEHLEKAFMGIAAGGVVPCTMIRDIYPSQNGNINGYIYGGYSTNTVAAAVACALRDMGLISESEAVRKALAIARHAEYGNDILASV